MQARVSLGSFLRDHEEDHDGAKTHYRSAIEIQPRCAIAHFKLADLLGACEWPSEYNAQDIDDAERHLNRAIEIDPHYVEAHFRLARLLREEREEADDADAHLNCVVKIDPQRAVQMHLDRAEEQECVYEIGEDVDIDAEVEFKTNMKAKGIDIMVSYAKKNSMKFK